MRTWLSSLWQSESNEAPCLELTVHRRDTIVYQKQLVSTHTFTIGHSSRNPVVLDSPSLPFERFPLVQFRAKEPWIQWTPSMRGSLVRGQRITMLDELVASGVAQRSPQGYRLLLPEGAALNLFLDDLLMRFQWTDAPTHNSFWGASMLGLDAVKGQMVCS